MRLSVVILWTIWRSPFFTAYVRWWNYYLGFLKWEREALSKRGVVCGTSVFRTESVEGKQRKDFYVVSYNDEPYLEIIIFLYVPSVRITSEEKTHETIRMGE